MLLTISDGATSLGLISTCIIEVAIGKCMIYRLVPPLIGLNVLVVIIGCSFDQIQM